MSSTTMKLFNKFSNNLIKDFIEHLENNNIEIPDEISNTFLIDKTSKRKGKLSPYTVFMKEFRSSYQKEHPTMSFQEVSQAIAKKWKEIKDNPENFQDYIDKANQHNIDIPKNNKIMCKATKGSDKQPCKAEAKNGEYCGRHKKLAHDRVDIQDIEVHSDSDYLSCQKNNCNRHANSGPFCSFHSKTGEKTCIKEKANGQLCGKIVKIGEYCGFHNPNKIKRKINKKTSEIDQESDAEIEQEVDIETEKEIITPIQEIVTSHTSSSSSEEIESDVDSEGEEIILYYDEDMNIYNNPPSKAFTSFISYVNDTLAYNNEGDEIGIIKDNKLIVF